ECKRGYFCEHESRVAVTTDKKWPVFDSWEIASKLPRERRPTAGAVVGAVDEPLRGDGEEPATRLRQPVDVLAHLRLVPLQAAVLRHEHAARGAEQDALRVGGIDEDRLARRPEDA